MNGGKENLVRECQRRQQNIHKHTQENTIKTTSKRISTKMNC